MKIWQSLEQVFWAGWKKSVIVQLILGALKTAKLNIDVIEAEHLNCIGNEAHYTVPSNKRVVVEWAQFKFQL